MLNPRVAYECTKCVGRLAAPPDRDMPDSSISRTKVNSHDGAHLVT